MNHGHVTSNPNGMKARCGGPKLCNVCSKEQDELDKMKKFETIIKNFESKGYRVKVL